MLRNYTQLNQSPFFGVRGRLNRKPHFLRKVVLFVINLIVSFVLMAILGLWGQRTGLNEITVQNLTGGMRIALVVAAIIFIITTVSWITLSIRRLHDLNHSGWWVLLNFVTVVNGFTDANWLRGIALLIWLAFNLYILFVKGTAGTNDFGDDPLMETIMIDSRNHAVPL